MTIVTGTRLDLNLANVSRISRAVVLSRLGLLGVIVLMDVLFLPASSAFMVPSNILFGLPLFRPLAATAIAALSTYSPQGSYSSLVPLPLEDAILNRYACKRFRRYNETVDETDNGSSTSASANTASTSDPVVVNQARHCLSLARRTPTAFNLQPYQVVLVSSPEQKLALSQYCLGPNAQRVRDADCTAIFLADRQVLRTLSRWQQLFNQKSTTGRAAAASTTTTDCEAPPPMNNADRRKRLRAWLTVRFYIALFSSGYPLPRCFAALLSFAVRTAVSFVNVFSRWFNFPLPTLGSAETWASKQASMVAMTYMLACSSLGLATIPMEGTCAGVSAVILWKGNWFYSTL
jgi:nitroreductase